MKPQCEITKLCGATYIMNKFRYSEIFQSIRLNNKNEKKQQQIHKKNNSYILFYKRSFSAYRTINPINTIENNY